MKQEVNPQDTGRARAFELWMDSPMPMVTLTKTLDVSRLCRMSRRHGLQFNMLMCWSIGRVASRIDEFFLLPVPYRRLPHQDNAMDDDVKHGKLFRYDRLAVNIIVNNKEGGINSCDIPYTDDLVQFNSDYQTLTKTAISTCKSSYDDDAMVVGTSAMTDTELDSIVNQYTEHFCNPMLIWGKYRKKLFRTFLPVSLQFHHVQMDGGHAARFLEELQRQIKTIKIQ